jgi:hypothetical protein
MFPPELERVQNLHFLGQKPRNYCTFFLEFSLFFSPVKVAKVGKVGKVAKVESR